MDDDNVPRNPPRGTRNLTVVSVKQAAQGSEDGALLSAATPLRCGLKHPSRQSREGKRLEPYPPRSLQDREEEPFPAEKSGLYPARLLDIEVHRGFDGDDASRIHMDNIARLELPLHHRSPGMDEYDSIPFEPLHDEAFPAEKAGEDLSLEKDPDGNALGGAKEAVFLADKGPPDTLEGNRDDIAGKRGRKGLSIRRAVRVSSSPGLPMSLRK